MPAPSCPFPLRIDQALCWAVGRLEQTAEPELAARLLLAHVLQCTVTDLFAHAEHTLTREEASAYQELVARRACHEPVAYLVGHREFWGLDLVVDARVLVPRPETEVLVERAMAVAKRWLAPRLADVGTGSGAVAVSLAVHLPGAQIFAIDASAGALQVARENARRLGVSGQITFLQGDLLAPVPVAVDLVVANLPYVNEAEFDLLPPGIRLYEPREALVAGGDGLDAIRALLNTVRPHLTDRGVILLEIGAGQGSMVSELAVRALPGARVEILQDYAHLDRVVHIELKP